MNGTCTSCEIVWAIDKKGRMEHHTYRGGVLTIACSGVGKYCKEERAFRKAKRNAKRQKFVDAVRAEAAVALDAHLAGRAEPEFLERYPQYKRLALLDYRLRYPDVRPNEAFVGVERPSGSRERIIRDIYCTFCRELLLPAVADYHGLSTPHKKDDLSIEVPLPPDYTFGIAHPVLIRHCVPCLLQHLAGMRVPLHPTTRKLPAEVS